MIGGKLMRFIKILLILCLSLVLISCTSNDSSKNDASSSQVSESTVNESPKEEVMEEEKEPSGIELLDSIEAKIPDSYILEMKTTISESITTTFKMTVMGEFSRIETYNNMTEKPMIILYNPELNAMFQYTEGDPVGMKFEGVDGSTGDMFWDDSNDFSNLELEEVKDSLGSGFIARKDTYKGQDAIYIEGSFAQEGESTMIKMWYSQEFFLPLKYEIYSGNQIVMTSEVISFDKNPSLTADDFLPPKTMQFQDLNMDMMEQ
jgi:outer membrane lipoprotein-sorting protein